ncbi:MlaC/ttg2D family ABC transporter substrate-binding protein [Marinomonas aquiplantarum]|uniref:Phospholipid transport system substrate-binding protein n=1 Tax=Marinomonas aquiplantarum TaxID=491951 RepID=A0A366CXJ6_9GAMM|nr:ABC transporter substrate-binding protein [Marinomonas aquiplantarum]RBO82557.1 phospholipid transport system substrate-binding protein [Marinomonas aquiplantarum]
MFKVFSSVFLMLSLLSISQAWAKDEEGARDAVIKVVEAFREDIVQDKAFLAENPSVLAERVDRILATVVDFDDFSRKVMGKYYRRATPEQRERFATVTKDTLLRTYGASLLELDPDKINVQPLGPQGRGRVTKVNVDFQMADAGLLNIVFYMEESKQQQWLLSNVVINNINFGLTFRRQFGVMMEQNQNNIEQAIDAWKASLAKQS